MIKESELIYGRDISIFIKNDAQFMFSYTNIKNIINMCKKSIRFLKII